MSGRDFDYPRYLATFERTNALLGTLGAFARGELSAEALEAWAQDIWPRDGTQDGLLANNRTAYSRLVNCWNAAAIDGSGVSILRPEDALRYIRELRHGMGTKMPRCIGNPSAPFRDLQRLLDLPTEREIYEGWGWMDTLRFASPGTGRTFLMLAHVPHHEGRSQVAAIHTETDGDAHDCLIDLLETLSIDLSDLAWRADEFAAISLPSWKLWRQDDNGVRALVDSFTGYRKARAALAAFEAIHHKQTYWLEEPA